MSLRWRSPSVDIHRNNETRERIEPWARIATAIDGIVTGVVHLIKMPGRDIIAGINGSSAFGEVPRAIFGFADDPKSDDGHRIMSQHKNSTGRTDLAETYAIKPDLVMTDTGKTAEVGKFVILGHSERTVADVLGEGIETSSVSGEAVDWLSDYLRTNPFVRSRDVKVEAKKEGFSESAMDRAARKHKVVATSKDYPRVTYWSPPGTAICIKCRKPLLASRKRFTWSAGSDGPASHVTLPPNTLRRRD